ncbi:MAG: diacylglycerol kinase family lipid kinase [Gammaproteobacteria bacterium]|nr:diacylglycerol kinase family lipid kinase [Gammaproteobacteria bacterium]MBT8105990.1 diacylglycerol kinase family lipid kinase [Gammaproteobacteria bacterium]NNK26004.1 diacylglycerol kinase family lipid kinase [Woeseiaceae bacterium]
MRPDAVQLFLNPTAGRGRAGTRKARIYELLTASGAPVEVMESRDVGDLESQVLAAATAGAQTIVVAGGDGSVHEAANGIMRAGGEAALGVVPSGTGNDFAKASDIPLDWERATRQLATRIRAQEQSRIVDIGRMNGRYFANGAGIGFDARVTQIARSYRVPIGDLVYLLAIFRGMLEGIATPHMRLTSDAGTRDGPVTLANIANGPWVGGMFHIAPMADNTDGAFDLVIAAPVSRLRILSLIPKLLSGKHVGEKEVSCERVTRVVVESDEAIPSHLDGEVQPFQRRFDIDLLPGALRLL